MGAVVLTAVVVKVVLRWDLYEPNAFSLCILEVPVDSTVGYHFNDLDLLSRSEWHDVVRPCTIAECVKETNTTKSGNGLKDVDRKCISSSCLMFKTSQAQLSLHILFVVLVIQSGNVVLRSSVCAICTKCTGVGGVKLAGKYAHITAGSTEVMGLLLERRRLLVVRCPRLNAPLLCWFRKHTSFNFTGRLFREEAVLPLNPHGEDVIRPCRAIVSAVDEACALLRPETKPSRSDTGLHTASCSSSIPPCHHCDLRQSCHHIVLAVIFVRAVTRLCWL